MTSVRTRTLAAGAVLAALAGILVDHGALFGSDFPPAAVLGVTLGAVLALVPHRSPVERMAGFAAGFGAAWLGYLVRTGLLPDIPLGRALTAVLVISLVTAVATATADRIPLWSGLVGIGALVGAYETAYLASPSDVAADSAVAATSVLLAAAFGFAATTVAAVFTSRPAAAPAPAHAAVEPLAPAGTPLPGPRVADDVPTPSETTR